MELTPFELRNGRFYKREDSYKGGGGTNGAKLRACEHLIEKARREGHRSIVTAASVLSPQHAIVANTARRYGLPSIHIVGASKPRTAALHPSVASALRAGAKFTYVPVAYNPFLQKAAVELQASTPGSYLLRYGITPPPDATPHDLAAFHRTGAEQVRNFPAGVRKLVMPFGSGNSAAGVMYGLSLYPPPDLEEVVLIGIGPDRQEWLYNRLNVIGGSPNINVRHFDLHGTGYAAYGDKMPETRDGIVFHPTYEGKVVRFLDKIAPDFWTQRDSTTAMWIVGGPLPQLKTKPKIRKAKVSR